MATHRPPGRSEFRLVRWVALAGLSLAIAACGDSSTSLGEAGGSCGNSPYFTALPVAPGDIDGIVVFGALGAPGHTLPTAHSGFYLARAGVPVASPGDIALTRVRTVTYTASPTRQGVTDYALFFQVCKDVEGWFGHLTSLSAAIPTGPEGSCQTYDTSDETVRSCETKPKGVTLAAGDPLGTGGLSAELGFLGLDFGLLDDRVRNHYAKPSRFPDPTFHAVCPYEYFDATNRGTLLAMIRDPAHPDEVPTGEPRCGTMEVDVDGTAQGVWAEVGVTGQVAGDETRYITLANYPYRPQERLALSLGPATLGAMVEMTPRATTGRVNRAFDQITGDGVLYCYFSGDPSSGRSWFLSLSSGGNLTMEKIEHGQGASPCAADPGSWAVRRERNDLRTLTERPHGNSSAKVIRADPEPASRPADLGQFQEGRA